MNRAKRRMVSNAKKRRIYRALPKAATTRVSRDLQQVLRRNNEIRELLRSAR